MNRLCLATLIGLAFGAVVFADAFQNGSFESPGGAPIYHSMTSCNDGFITGWVHNFPSCDGWEVYQSAGQSGITRADAGDGLYFVGFGANGRTGGTLSQTFDTMIGLNYSVGFLVALEHEAPEVAEPQRMMLQALDGLSVLATVTNIDFLNFNWAPGPTLSFTAVSTSTTLRFTDLTTHAGAERQNWVLDMVSVSSVPEPGSFALLCGALAALAVARRKRAGAQSVNELETQGKGRR